MSKNIFLTTLLEPLPLHVPQATAHRTWTACVSGSLLARAKFQQEISIEKTAMPKANKLGCPMLHYAIRDRICPITVRRVRAPAALALCACRQSRGGQPKLQAFIALCCGARGAHSSGTQSGYLQHLQPRTQAAMSGEAWADCGNLQTTAAAACSPSTGEILRS
jgi:hypothetical protein